MFDKPKTAAYRADVTYRFWMTLKNLKTSAEVYAEVEVSTPLFTEVMLAVQGEYPDHVIMPCSWGALPDGIPTTPDEKRSAKGRTIAKAAAFHGESVAQYRQEMAERATLSADIQMSRHYLRTARV